MRYGFEYSNQDIEKKHNFVFLKATLESAGNLLYAYSKFTNHTKSTTDSIYQYFGVPFFQYFKTDIDFRHYNIINQGNKVVSRIFIGVGYPYGNSISLPFEKKYFAGGPNGIRAWSTRSLGPGSYQGDTVGYPNSLADMKLEANLEYRFHLIWKLEGAFFIDAGNIWSVRNEPSRPGAEFKWNKFYKDIAVGSGFGTRFDFSYLLIRFDFGIKLRDPAIQGDNKWIIANRPFRLSDFTIQFGLGYPF
jgi:outer membrane protein assembly factor BamA